MVIIINILNSCFREPYMDKQVVEWGRGKFSTRKIFKKFLGGWKIFPFRFLVNFDVFLVDFDAKTHMRGENLSKIPNGGWKITTRTTPQKGGGIFFPFHVLVAFACMTGPNFLETFFAFLRSFPSTNNWKPRSSNIIYYTFTHQSTSDNH